MPGTPLTLLEAHRRIFLPAMQAFGANLSDPRLMSLATDLLPEDAPLGHDFEFLIVGRLHPDFEDTELPNLMIAVSPWPAGILEQLAELNEQRDLGIRCRVQLSPWAGSEARIERVRECFEIASITTLSTALCTGYRAEWAPVKLLSVLDEDSGATKQIVVPGTAPVSLAVIAAGELREIDALSPVLKAALHGEGNRLGSAYWMSQAVAQTDPLLQISLSWAALSAEAVAAGISTRNRAGPAIRELFELTYGTETGAELYAADILPTLDLRNDMTHNGVHSLNVEDRRRAYERAYGAMTAARKLLLSRLAGP